jgi:excisionase family DNA binding protein
MQQQWGNCKQVAKYLGVSARTVRNLIAAGLPCSRVNHKSIYIQFRDVDSFLKNYQVKAERVENLLEAEGFNKRSARVDSLVDSVCDGL